MGVIVKENSAKKISNYCSILFILTIIMLSVPVLATAPTISDASLLDQTEARAAKYFYEQSLSTGFVKDTTAKNFTSIAATGFGLSAFTVMAERYGTTSNWTYTPAQLRTRTNQILDNIITIQNNQASNPSKYGIKGLLFHWFDSSYNPVNGDGVSTIDNAILFAGVITAGEYFGDEVKQKADRIVSNADWSYFLKTPQNNFSSNGGNTNYYQFSMGWNSKLFKQTWDRPTDEAILISLLAVASNPNNIDFQKSLFSWPRVTRSYAEFNLVNSYNGSLFTYIFAHIFVDFNKIGKDVPSRTTPGVQAIDWWQNSISAAKANRQFCIDNSGTYSSYGADSWGLSSVERPNTTYFGSLGALPNDNMVSNQDGTVAPYSSISTMPFFKNEDGGVLMNNYGFRVLRNLYNTKYDSLWGAYGPKDSFNQNNQYSNITSGIDQGPIALMLENYRTGFVQNQFMKNTSIKAAMTKLFSCPEGVCNPDAPVCSDDSQCNDNNSKTTDACVSPGTVSSNCTHTPIASTCVTPVTGMQISNSMTFCAGSYNVFDINIAEDNVVLDCAGANFTIPTTSAFYRFRITNRNNVTLKNCVTGKSNYGVYILNSNLINLINNTFSNSYDSGIAAFNSDKLNIIGNTASGNEYSNGLYLNNVKDSNIANNTFSNNGNTVYPNTYAGGITLINSERNNITNNTIENNARGIYLISSNNNYFSQNQLCHNTNTEMCTISSNNTATANIIPYATSSNCPWLNTNAISCNYPTCTDTDGGVNLNIQGTVRVGGGIYEDVCIDASILHEFSCLNNTMHWERFTCTSGCLNGACINQTITCSTNIECNDNDSQTTDTCINPGTTNSSCQHTFGAPICSQDSDCGSITYSENQCIIHTGADVNKMSDKIIREKYIPYCSNPNTTDSSCGYFIQEEIIENCSNGCLNGACIMPTITCSTNIECNDNDSQTTDTCINPGTTNSSCQNIKPTVACSSNSDCGINDWLGIFSCKGSKVLETYRTFTCKSPGKTNSVCTSTDSFKIKEKCTKGQLCNLGACVTPTCTNTTQCNDNNSYTVDNCINPGKITSTCTHTQITCSTNTDCDDSNSATGDECINPGTITSYCKYAQPNPHVLWNVIPSSDQRYFGSTTCNIETQTTCPAEMGWEGKTVTYKFTLPNGALTENLILEFNVIFGNWGPTENVLLKISTKNSATSYKVINPSFEITGRGVLQVTIPTSNFKQGQTNYIKLQGINISPTGYGTTPPNFKINWIRLVQDDLVTTKTQMAQSIASLEIIDENTKEINIAPLIDDNFIENTTEESFIQENDDQIVSIISETPNQKTRIIKSIN